MADYNLTQTGAEVQALLDAVASGYVFLGTATPTTTPDTTNPNVCYLATTPGTYTSFGSATLAEGYISVLCWNGTTWTKHESEIKVATDATPVDNSVKPVQSGGVYNSLETINTKIDKIAIPTTATGYKINTNGAIGSTLPTPSANASYRYMKYPVSEGDIVYVNGKGGSAPRVWCFADSSDKIISQADYSSAQIVATLTAPANSAYIVINDTSNSTSYYLSKDALAGKIASIKGTQTSENGFIKSALKGGDGNTTNIYTKIDSTSIYIPDETLSQVAIYEECIKEIWVDSRYLVGLPYICCKSYGNKVHVFARTGVDSGTTWQAVVSIENVSNGDIVPLVVSVASGNASLGDIVGYVIFSNVSTFKATTYTGSKTYLNYNRAISLDYNRTIWSGIMQTTESVNSIVANAMSGGLDVVLPSTIYAAVGVQLNIYNDTIALSMDKGLISPTNYIVRWSCAKGTITNRCFRFTPKSTDVGDVTLTCYVYTTGGSLIITKSVTIKVVSASIGSQKNVLFIGDSTGSGSINAIYENFSDSSLYSGTAPVFVGSKGTTPKWEGFGGARWADFSTEGRKAFRCQVSGVGAIELGSTYTNNGYTWTVIEVNVTEGTGNILITRNDLPSSTITPQTNGTLISTSGGEDIPYTNATEESGNIFWYNGAISFSHYRSVIGLSGTIDLVAIQLGLNGYENLATTRQYIIDFYNAAIADNANCIVLLGLVTGPANSVDAYGVNYGASDWMSSISKYYNRRKLYLELAESGDYPNLRIATPNLNIDRYYGFPLGTRVVSARNNTTEEYHTNFVHPASSGYAQIGDAFFSAYIATLTEA